jgi:hypothetical protein
MAYCQCLSPEPVDLRLPIGVLNRAGRFYRIFDPSGRSSPVRSALTVEPNVRMA